MRQPNHDVSMSTIKSAEQRDVQALGARTRYVEAGAGDPVVLIHGLGMSTASWRANIGPLSRTHHVLALDLPGHGYSEMPREQYSLKFGVRFMDAFLDAVGLARVSLVGESMGGLVALNYALERPQRVTRLVLVDSGGLGREVALFLRALSVPLLGEALIDPGLRGTRALLRLLLHRSNWHLITDDLVRDVAAARTRPGNKRALLAALRTGVNAWGQKPEFILAARLPRLQPPLFTVWGAQDGVIPVSHAHRAHQAVSGSRLRVFDQCGHWPQMEKAEQFNALVEEFLQP